MPLNNKKSSKGSKGLCVLIPNRYLLTDYKGRTRVVKIGDGKAKFKVFKKMER